MAGRAVVFRCPYAQETYRVPSRAARRIPLRSHESQSTQTSDTSDTSCDDRRGRGGTVDEHIPHMHTCTHAYSSRVKKTKQKTNQSDANARGKKRRYTGYHSSSRPSSVSGVGNSLCVGNATVKGLCPPALLPARPRRSSDKSDDGRWLQCSGHLLGRAPTFNDVDCQ